MMIRMGAGKIVGGILAIASGVLTLISFIYMLVVWSVSITHPVMTSNLILLIVVLVGGILGITVTKVGGGLALGAGCVWIIGTLYSLLAGEFIIANISIISELLPVFVEVFYFGIIEISLAIVGGIVILASSSE